MTYASHVHSQKKINSGKEEEKGTAASQRCTTSKEVDRELSQMLDRVLQQSHPPLVNGRSGIKINICTLSSTAA
jgi:hypothetical protein